MVVTSVVIRGKTYTHTLCVCIGVYSTSVLVCVSRMTPTHTGCQMHKFQCHGQTTCLSHGPFLKAVAPAGTDSLWKTCLNESTHQLHQHILTSLAAQDHPPPPLRLTLLCPFPTALYSSHISYSFFFPTIL